MLPFLSFEVYLADDFVSIAEEPGFVNDFFQKILKNRKSEKNARNRRIEGYICGENGENHDWEND